MSAFQIKKKKEEEGMYDQIMGNKTVREAYLRVRLWTGMYKIKQSDKYKKRLEKELEKLYDAIVEATGGNREKIEKFFEEVSAKAIKEGWYENDKKNWDIFGELMELDKQKQRKEVKAASRELSEEAPTKKSYGVGIPRYKEMLEEVSEGTVEKGTWKRKKKKE